jgi:thiol-disulfide isomerase/thioredoxin
MSHIIGLEQASQKSLESSGERTGVLGAILTGAALGPVFSSCSPTYSLILATVLPQSFAVGLTYLIVYGIGLGVVLLGISIFGQRLVKRLKWAANPNGLFKKFLGVLFILVGLAIITGIDKRIEQGILDIGFFDVTKLEQRILSSIKPVKSGFGNSTTPTTLAPTTPKVANTPARKPSFPLKYDGTVTAPELAGLSNWINSNPLTLAELKGKVVLIDFWTYSCINCQRTLPYLVEWDKKYRDDGLVIIGVHAPEFAFEKDPKNVLAATKEAGIEYPVVLDNDFTTWRAYENQYWPAKYFIDRDGKLRHSHFGEGAYAESEQVIQYLLGTPKTSTVTNPGRSSANGQTPEIYLGFSRAEEISNSNYNLGAGTYTLATSLSKSEVSLGGSWKVGAEKINGIPGSKLRINATAKDIYLVISGATNGTIQVQTGNVANKSPDVANGYLSLRGDTIYHIASFDRIETSRTIELELQTNAALHAFTFGS